MDLFKSLHMKFVIILLTFMICTGFLQVSVNGKSKRENTKCYECNKGLNSGRNCHNDLGSTCAYSDTKFCSTIIDNEGKVFARKCNSQQSYENMRTIINTDYSKANFTICKCYANKCNDGKTCAGTRLDTNGLFWTTGLVLIGYSLSFVIGKAAVGGDGRFSMY